MRKIQFFSLLCMLVFLFGCAVKPKLKPDVNFNTDFARQINAPLAEYQKRYDCSARMHTYTVDYKTNIATCNESSTFAEGLNEARRVRNEATERVIRDFDINYGNFISDIESNRSTGSFLAAAVELSASAAVGITKGRQRAIQIIGIALTAFRGGRKSY